MGRGRRRLGQPAEGCGTVLEDREGAVQPHGVQHGQDESGRRHQTELAAALSGLLMGADQKPQSGRVDDLDLGEIDENPVAEVDDLRECSSYRLHRGQWCGPEANGEPIQPLSNTSVQTTSASGRTHAVPVIVSPQPSQISVIR